MTATDDERLAAIRADYTCPCPEGAGIVRNDVCLLLALVDRLKAELEIAWDDGPAEEEIKRLRARVARLESVEKAARVYRNSVGFYHAHTCSITSDHDDPCTCGSDNLDAALDADTPINET